MNKTLTVLLTMILMMISSADGFAWMKVLEVGKSWTYQSFVATHPEVMPSDPYCEDQVVEEVIENGRSVFIIHSFNYKERNDVFISKAYEENGVYYFYSEEYMDYVPLFDFNLEVGDVIDDYEKVIKKEYVSIEGIERCVITIESPNGNLHYWVEGIGSITDFALTPLSKPIGINSKMIQCKIGDTLLFKDDKGLEKFLDYCSNVEVQQEDESSIVLYDLSGRKISVPEKGHIYIKSSTKIIYNPD